MYRQSWVFVILVFIQVTTAALDLTTDDVPWPENSPEKNDGTEIKVELDMILTPEQEEALYGRATGPQARKARRDPRTRWPGGVVPYQIESALYSNLTLRRAILRAMNEWERYTCINFRPATSADKNYIFFGDGKGCLSYVGMTGRGKQKVTLQSNYCFTGRDGGHRVVLHEIGHAVGFYHEQNRADRNDYVTIRYENIIEKWAYAFRLIVGDINNYSIPYDYKSVMHYWKGAFAKEAGLLTVETKDKSQQEIIGRAKSLSFRDIKLANLMYNCNARCSNKSVTCPGEGFVDKSCRCMCPGDPIMECSSSSVNECASNPCLNGGTCRDGSGYYTCACRTGFTGSRCQSKVTCSDDFSWCAAWSNIIGCANTYVADKCRKTCRRCS